MKTMSDAVFEEMRTTAAGLRAWIDIQNAQIAHLIEQIIELKRDGFARPQPQMVQEHTKRVYMDDRIMAAIRAMAPEGSRLEGELMQFADAALMIEGTEIEDVADRILAGSSIGDDD